MTAETIRKVGFVLVDGFSLMSLSSALEPLRAANHLSQKILYEITFIPAEGLRAVSSSGVYCEGHSLIDAGYDFDLVLVAAAGNPAVYKNNQLMKYLKMLASKRVRLGGISGGPVLLAKAGLLENRRYTVHWDHYVALCEMSQEQMVERTVYLIDRDRYTCAGGVAPMDMMSAIITADHGRDLAKQVNDWFIYTSVREASEPQRGSLVDKYQIHHPAVLCAIELMQNHLSDPLSSADLAELSDIGERQMVRLFHKYLSQKPMAFYGILRLEHARVLVMQTSLPIIQVAIEAGYENAAYFTKKFKVHFGQTPSEMREKARTDP